MNTINGVYYLDTYKQAKEYASSKGWPTTFIRCYQRGYAIQRGISSTYLGPDNEHLPICEVPTWAEVKQSAIHTH